MVASKACPCQACRYARKLLALRAKGDARRTRLRKSIEAKQDRLKEARQRKARLDRRKAILAHRKFLEEQARAIKMHIAKVEAAFEPRKPVPRVKFLPGGLPELGRRR